MSASVTSIPSTGTQRFQKLVQLAPASAAPTMMLGSSAALSSKASEVQQSTSGYLSTPKTNVKAGYAPNSTSSRRAAPVRFATSGSNNNSGLINAGFSIRSSQANVRCNRNYFDSKMGATRAGRRGDVKMMDFYNVTLVTPDGE